MPLRDMPRQRDHQPEGVLGGGDGIAAGCVHDDDAALGRRRQINIVDADAGAPYRLQLRRLRNQLSVGCNTAANDQGVGVTYRLKQGGSLQLGGSVSYSCSTFCRLVVR